jgi:hypothetical protein
VSTPVGRPASHGPGFPMLGDTPMRRETKRRMDDTGLVLVDASTCRIEPDSGVDDFRPALKTAAYERSGAANATVTVDALHLARSGGSPTEDESPYQRGSKA